MAGIFAFGLTFLLAPLSGSLCWAQENWATLPEREIQALFEDQRTRVIPDPTISARCQVLMEKRLEKQQIKGRLAGLEQRVQRLLRRAPERRRRAKQNLKVTARRVKREKELNELQTNELEEKIIRRGCPSFFLDPGE